GTATPCRARPRRRATSRGSSGPRRRTPPRRRRRARRRWRWPACADERAGAAVRGRHAWAHANPPASRVGGRSGGGVMGMPHVVVDDAGYAYPGRTVLAHVDARASAGDRLAIVGENGSGKTTLLRLLAGDLAPSTGEVRVVGTLAVVEQEMAVAPGATVGDVVAATLADVRAVAAELEAATEAFDHEEGALGELTALLARAEHLAAWDADRRVTEALSRLGAC